jgi:DNA-binding transcriptional MerR regulator
MASERPELRDGVYSIGAVASMLGLPPATLRTWEERYAAVSPSRTPAGQRLYSRHQVEELRFITAEMDKGMSAADAHRLLANRREDVGHADEQPGAASSRSAEPSVPSWGGGDDPSHDTDNVETRFASGSPETRPAGFEPATSVSGEHA